MEWGEWVRGRIIENLNNTVSDTRVSIVLGSPCRSSGFIGIYSPQPIVACVKSSEID